MEFSNIVDDLVKRVPKLYQCHCENYRYEEGASLSFTGYDLKNCYYRGAPVSLGILTQAGYITGFRVVLDGANNDVVLREPVFLCDLQVVLRDLVQALADNKEVGCKEWISFTQCEKGVSTLQSSEQLARGKDGLFGFDSVIVDLGFTTCFSSVVLGRVEQKCVIAIVEKMHSDCVYYVPLYEAVLDAKEGNELYLEIKNSCFLSKKGNKIYRLSKDSFFKHFKRVSGASIRVEGV